MVTIEQLKKEQLQARKDRASVKATLLTTLLGEIQGKVTALDVGMRTEAKEAEIVQARVTSFLKQNREAQEHLQKAGDTDKVQQLKEEESILVTYQPVKMSADELRVIIKEKFPEITEKNKGPIVGFLKKNYGDKVDGALAQKVIAELVG